MVQAVTRPGYQTGVVPQETLGWPSIPGVTYTGLITTRYYLDFGAMLDKGIVSNYPPSLTGRAAYPIFVSNVDRDGNEVAGIRLPPVEAPIATTTGWALRRAGLGENDGCEANGQHITFKTTKAERTGGGRSAPVARGALHESRGIRGGCDQVRRATGEATPPPPGRRAAVHRTGQGQRCASRRRTADPEEF